MRWAGVSDAATRGTGPWRATFPWPQRGAGWDAMRHPRDPRVVRILPLLGRVGTVVQPDDPCKEGHVSRSESGIADAFTLPGWVLRRKTASPGPNGARSGAGAVTSPRRSMQSRPRARCWSNPLASGGERRSRRRRRQGRALRTTRSRPRWRRADGRPRRSPLRRPGIERASCARPGHLHRRAPRARTREPSRSGRPRTRSRTRPSDPSRKDAPETDDGCARTFRAQPSRASCAVRPRQSRARRRAPARAARAAAR